MYDPHSIYRGKYREFIDSILTKRPHNKYFENSSCHHVIPSCCEGVDNDEDNIRIYLHHREHMKAMVLEKVKRLRQAINSIVRLRITRKSSRKYSLM